MKKSIWFAVCILVGSCPSALNATGRDGQGRGDARPLMLVHYMPWFQTPSVHGYWGWHWTMDHYNPAVADANGRRQIASHVYPLTGPYDSKDTLILEYQTLLMKVSGIDGVLVDWASMDAFYDYGINNEGTQALFHAIQKAGLSFGIVYEDGSVGEMVRTGYITAGNALSYGKTVMQYMQSHWFSTATYVRLDNRPLLLNFGPQYFFQSAEWDSLFSGLPTRPAFITLNSQLAPAASGAFPWPPMWLADASGVVSQGALDGYLAQFYLTAQGWPVLVAGAFPGFHDIYSEAGAGSSYGYLDDRQGATFRSTLQQALLHQPDVIQLVTWNDYGEGTVIEPTVEFGYRYLETVRSLRDSLEPAFPFMSEDLELPLRLYNARGQSRGQAGINAVLDRVFGLVVSGARAAAAALLDSLLADKSIIAVNTQTVNLGQINVNEPHRDTSFTVTNSGAGPDSMYITLDYVNVFPESAVSVSPRAFAIPAGGIQNVTFSVTPGLLTPDVHYNSVIMMDSRFGFGPAHFDKVVVFEVTGTLSAGDGSPDLPTAFALLQNYPNPGNPSTTIRYELPQARHVRMTLYDLLGREVQTLADGMREPGCIQ